MAIIIGDIHGDLTMASAFLDYKPDVEHVALGDLVDSRDPKTTLGEELECLELLLASQAVLLWGNHDLAYLPEHPWQNYTRHKQSVAIFEEHYQRSRTRFKAAHAVDGWLCTHAGVSTSLTAALPDGPWYCGDMAAIADWLNGEFARGLAIPRGQRGAGRERPYGDGPLFNIDWTRGGKDQYGGMFWYDPGWEPSHPPDPRVRQIFAHTKVEGPMRKGNWVNIHIEGGSGYWVYDTVVDDFVVLRQ